ncbi:RNA methyltransferase [uncultured Cytophaga sp.]|uniref:RNA methyltransferase n=1 Tax=uncultured Cytophaga sp. TaxID=160238 RepID=UPI00262AC5BD|nr:RNA methyltransferase [uncultured Cytophaga sp.]
MLSKQTVKFTKSLQNKKFRRLYKQFIIEGEKSVLEVLHSDLVIHKILVTDYFETTYKSELKPYLDRIEKASEKELNDIGTLQTNDSAIVICDMKPETTPGLIENEWTIVLDNINDPGNLGTIIRVADWYGIKQIICSEETADFYNPKVINASKGSFLRVAVHYTDLIPFLSQQKVPVYGADLDGENIHQSTFGKQGVLVMGNEAHGLRDEIKNLLTQTISIPRFGMAESLNVGIATAICCDRIAGQRGH